MYHENKQQIHLAIFIICLFFSLISHPYNQNIVQAKAGETNTGKLESGMVETISNTGEINGKEEESGRIESEGSGLDKVIPYSCGISCKIEALTIVGIIPEIAESLVTNCKALANDPIRCIKIGAFIVVNESSGGKSCKNSNQYNCFGLSVKEDYKSYNDGVLHFVGKYNRFWLNQTNPNSFYSNSPDWKPVTRFCMSENSSGLPYCKNGHRIAWSVFNKLNKLF